MSEHFDVLIIGAGLSGIGAAYHVQKRCPRHRFAILEGGDDLGGTWKLFRYPGVRSDSDMFTLGFPFHPWKGEKQLASGASILDYLREVAEVHGIDRHIRFRHRVSGASWSSADARWTLEIADPGGGAPRVMTCDFLVTATGYYDYAQAHAPRFAGEEVFAGSILLPQFWPEDVDYAGKRVVVVGSGATAVTIVPAMTDKAAHVVMLQRSPTYIVDRPAIDGAANWLRRMLPLRMAYRLIRLKNILLQMYYFRLARTQPEKVRGEVIRLACEAAGPGHDPVHFTPRYNPWDQRLCFAADGDLFDALRGGKASIVTDEIAHFTTTGVVLKSGDTIDADIVVKATGLSLQLMSKLALTVDGARVDPAQSYSYKGIMYSGIPNLASIFGSTNVSWTLRADLACAYVCRLLGRMRSGGIRQVTPHVDDPAIKPLPFLDFSSGYVQRAMDQFPKQGSHNPWRTGTNYIADFVMFRLSPVLKSMRVVKGRTSTR